MRISVCLFLDNICGMKNNHIFLSLFLCFTILVNANMASPIQPGTLVANPFLNQYVRVVNENIFIKIDSGFYYADFDIEYEILSEKDGLKIPLLFYAYNYDDDFKVSIDGKEIKLNTELKFWDLHTEEEKLKFKNYHYLFTNDREVISNTVATDGLNMHDLLYFETDISKGKHTIKVTYKASRWLHQYSRLNEYSFKYVLSPAKYWKSFGTLNIKVDATDFKEEITTNLGNAVSGDLEAIANYHFKALPTETLVINYQPKISKVANFLIKIDSFSLALIFSLFFVAIHLFAMKKYRKQNTKKWISAIAVLGGLFIPFLFVIFLIVSSAIIDVAIGKHASGRAGYGMFYMFILVPKFILYYLSFSLIMDYVFKRIKT